MRARQNEYALRATCGDQSAENLRLLAAHHVWTERSFVREHARDDADRTERLALDRDDGSRGFRQARRTANIGRFDPTLTRADHTGHQNWRRFVRSPPGAEKRSEQRFVFFSADTLNAARRLDSVDDRAACADQISPERTRAPIYRDEFRQISGRGNSLFFLQNDLSVPPAPRPF